jgi:hypothetical protein
LDGGLLDGTSVAAGFVFGQGTPHGAPDLCALAPTDASVRYPVAGPLVLIQLRGLFSFPFSSCIPLGTSYYFISPSHMPAGLYFIVGLDPVVCVFLAWCYTR